MHCELHKHTHINNHRQSVYAMVIHTQRCRHKRTNKDKKEGIDTNIQTCTNIHKHKYAQIETQTYLNR